MSKLLKVTVVFFISIGLCWDVYCQDYEIPQLTIGDSAPALQLGSWLKGDTIRELKLGDTYVLEFWATWCRPCIAAMPHLSEIARRYRGRAKFLSINVFEKSVRGAARDVKSFVDSMSKNMDYNVAIQDSNYMETSWLIPAKSASIPCVFIINNEGKISWIGHPRDRQFENILDSVLAKNWDIGKALALRNERRYLARMDDSLRFQLMQYVENDRDPNDVGKPDSAIFAINQIVKSEPKLKYAPFISSYTFKALLRIDQARALQYGREVISNTTYDEPAYNSIIWQIEWYSKKLKLIPQIYELGAEALEMKVGRIAPEAFLQVAPKLYHQKAEWYALAQKMKEAIDAETLAISLLQKTDKFSKQQLELYKLSLVELKHRLGSNH